MIKINLLPDTQAKSRSSRKAPARAGGGGGSAMIFLALIAFVAVDGFLFYTTLNKVNSAKAELSAKEKDLKSVEDDIQNLGPEAQEIQDLRTLFEAQWEILQSLDNRILWSEKLNMMARLVPPNVFLTDIQVTENFKEVEIKASIEARESWEARRGKNKGEKPEVVKKPVVTYNLILTGLATGEDPVQQLDNVYNFHEALVSHEETGRDGQPRRFMDYFDSQIEIKYVEATLYEKQYPVQRFQFAIKSLPLSSEDEELLLNAEGGKKGRK